MADQAATKHHRLFCIQTYQSKSNNLLKSCQVERLIFVVVAVDDVDDEVVFME